MKQLWLIIPAIALIVAGFTSLTTESYAVGKATPTPLPGSEVTGTVIDENGPVEGAVVRVRATDNQTLSADDGSFILRGITATTPISVTAWITGHYASGVTVEPGDEEAITLKINAYHTTDNPGYEIKSAEECGVCHTNLDEWKADAHAQSAINPRFLTIYNGTDIYGNRTVIELDSKGMALPPDPDKPYFGPGFKADFPDRDGNCAACHTPAASKLETENTCGWSGCHTNFTASMSDEVPYGANPNYLTGAAVEGITCDFCHKVGDVILNEDGLPPSAKPGISSMKLYRPADDGQDLFLGTFDDIPPNDSRLPLLEESAYCSSCHFGFFGGVAGHNEVVGGVAIYNSYGEWLNSPYSNEETGQTCQDCHMPTVDYDYFVFPEQGGFPRGGENIHNHTMPGARDEEFLQNAVSMTTTTQIEGDTLLVEVEINNDNTGHWVPTGIPMRHVMLVVNATDATGDPLPLQNGSLLPEWTGNYAEQPGQYYAKIIKDTWTGEVPTVAFWRNIELVEDTRLRPFEPDVSQYAFTLPKTDDPVTVEAHLIFRRAYQELMEQKGWDDPDIVMKEDIIEVTIP